MTAKYEIKTFPVFMILHLTRSIPLPCHSALCSFPQSALLFVALSNLLIKADLNIWLPMPFSILHMYRNNASSTDSWSALSASISVVKINQCVLRCLGFPCLAFLPFPPPFPLLLPLPFFHSRTHLLSLTCLASSRTFGKEVCLISMWNENRLYQPRSSLPAWLSQRILKTF